MEELKDTQKTLPWNDNLSEEALEDFDTLLQVLGKQSVFGYNCHQTIGLALKKLKLLEEQGAMVDENKLNKGD